MSVQMNKVPASDYLASFDTRAMARTLSVTDQRVWLSVLGLEAWRMHRIDGVPQNMALELLLPQAYEHLNGETLYAIVANFCAAPDYAARGWALLEDFELALVLASTRGRSRHQADGDPARTLVLRADHLWDKYRLVATDRRVAMVNRLATLMAMHVSFERKNDAAIQPLVDVWFDVCDTAIGYQGPSLGAQ